MARKYLVPIDLTKQELQNARIQNLASAPASPAVGQIYYDTTVNTLYFWNGTAWVNSASSVAYGTLASRPAASASNNNTLFYATDNALLYVSNGTTWSQVSSFGSGASTTVDIAGSAADGSSTSYARADHTHAGPGFGTVVAQTTYNASTTSGSATTVARSDHSHGTPAHGAAEHSAIKISDLAAPAAEVSFGSQRIKDLADPINAQNAATKAYVDGRKVTDLTAPTSAFSMNGQKITNLGSPTADTDAATKEYVDAVAEGLHIHASCDAATTDTLANLTGGSVTYSNGTNGVGATLTLSVALTTLDGYTLQNGNRILVKDQASQLQNGIYTWATGGTVLTRASDFNSATEIAGGDFTFVTNGTLYNNTGWVQTEAVNTVGTDAVLFQQFSGAGTYTAGDGLTLTGSVFAFNPTATGGLGASAGGASIKLVSGSSGLLLSESGLAVHTGSGLGISNTGSVAIDTSIVARKYSVAVGDTTNTSYLVTHNLGTRDVTVSVRETSSPYAKVEPDIAMTTTDAVTVSFAVAPGTNQYTVTVIG